MRKAATTSVIKYLPPENAYYHSKQYLANNDEKCVQIRHKSISSMTGTQDTVTIHR